MVQLQIFFGMNDSHIFQHIYLCFIQYTFESTFMKVVGTSLVC